MFSLEELLVGVQAEETRQTPILPSQLQQVMFTDSAIDSREVTASSLFVALPGARVDGHSFVADAVANGARGVLVNREKIEDITLEQPWVRVEPDGQGLEQVTPETVLLIAVEDPMESFHRLAAYHRGLFAPTVIGITGSVGKTSTKEVTAAVLQRRYRTLKNPRSYNNESTLPIVLLQLTGSHEVAVLEMGCYGPGDVALLADIARPHIGIVTNVGPSHIERMGSLETIAGVKSELVQALPTDGHAILNIDDPRVRPMVDKTSARPFLYGLDPGADLWADQIESKGLEGISFRAHHAGEDVFLKLPLLGRHSVHTALAATATGLILGMGWDAIIDGLRDESAQLRLLAVPGVGGATLIDDTYNASPISSMAALNLLADLDGRRIAVLGDMLELGDIEEKEHRRIGGRVAEVANILIVIGDRAKWIAEEARASGMPNDSVIVATKKQEVIDTLQGILQQNDYVLVKGSRGAALEGIVAALQQQPGQ